MRTSVPGIPYREPSKLKMSIRQFVHFGSRYGSQGDRVTFADFSFFLVIVFCFLMVLFVVFLILGMVGWLVLTTLPVSGWVVGGLLVFFGACYFFVKWVNKY